ncbi:MAG TPA: glycosyltransferase family 87 protein, partial [Myxococcaceae bacterium]|nr:glycosyltransferase family 87 protein [Myxococcaceae bacterium]
GATAGAWWRAGLILLLAVLVAHAWLLKPGGDFHVFWLAGRRTLDGVFPYQAADGLYPFKYAPPVALFLAPLALVPERLASGLWLALSAFGLLRLVRWSQATLGGGADGRRELFLLLALLPFVTHLLGLGQSEGLLLWLMVESEDRRVRTPLLSGALWAVACLFKPPFAVFLALVVWRRELRRGLGLAAGVAGSFALLALVLGPAAMGSQLTAWRSVLAASTPAATCGAQNQSLLALVCSVTSLGPGDPGFIAAVALAAGCLVAAGMAAVASCARRSPAEGERLAVSLTFYATALFSPLGWRTNLLALGPALALLFARGRAPDPLASGVRIGSATALALTVVVLNYDVLGPDRFRQILEHRAYGWLGLALVLCTVLVGVRSAMAPARATG